MLAPKKVGPDRRVPVAVKSEGAVLEVAAEEAGATAKDEGAADGAADGVGFG